MTKIRYNYIKNTVNSLFIKLNINSYPIDMINFSSHFINCKVIPYSKWMKIYNLTEDEVLKYLGSDEGCTAYSPEKNRYLIFYNDLNTHYKVYTRRRWTLAHEFGHVFLKHLTMTNKIKIFRNNLIDEEYDWLEAEANRFASLLLANPIILYKLNVSSELDVMKICKLSEEAAKYRYDNYLKWIKNKYINKDDCTIISQFHDFIYKKYCTVCGHAFVAENANYCPICGHTNLERGNALMKYREGIELDKNNHAIVCPRCGNEDIKSDDTYCTICGAYLIQECAGVTDTDINGNEYIVQEGCKNINLKSNSRYCPICGGITTFYKHDYLKDWEKEKAEIEEENSNEQLAATSDNVIKMNNDIEF